MIGDLLGELAFESLELIKVPVKIGKDKYILVEADGDTTAKFKSLMMKSSKMDQGKVILGDGIADGDKLLVAECLYKVDAEGKQSEVPVGHGSGKWPGHIIASIAERAKKISKLNVSKDTKEELQKKIKELQDQLTKLEESPEGKQPAG